MCTKLLWRLSCADTEADRRGRDAHQVEPDIRRSADSRRVAVFTQALPSSQSVIASSSVLTKSVQVTAAAAARTQAWSSSVP